LYRPPGLKCGRKPGYADKYCEHLTRQVDRQQALARSIHLVGRQMKPL
jgi:hypothetical protein